MRRHARQAKCMGREPGVIGSRQSEKSWQPGGGGDPRAAPACRSRPSAGSTPARLPYCATARLSGPHRPTRRTSGLLTHSLDEGVDVPRVLECRGDAIVGLSPRFAGERVLDASGAADQDESTDVEVRGRHHVKGDTRPEGVAQEVTTAVADRGGDGIAHQRSRCRQVGAHRVRPGMARQVDADEDMVLGQMIAEGSPQPRRLRESVQEDNRLSGTRTALFDMEGHAW